MATKGQRKPEARELRFHDGPAAKIFREPAPAKWREQALHHDMEIRRLVESMKQSKQSLIRSFAELFGAPEEQDSDRLIWHGIVRFADSDLSDVNSLEEGLSVFKAFTTLCENRFAGPIDFRNPMEDLSSFSDLEFEAARTNRALYQTLGDQARALQKKFRAMLTWLADPNACLPESRKRALQFLLVHGAEGAIASSIDPNDEFDETGNQGAPLFYWKHASSYATIMSPVAKFILDRLERYHANELTLKEAIPLIICKRSDCGKFAVPRRRTKDFCSDSCRTLHRQETKPEAWAAYMRKYREENYKKW